MGNLKSLFKIAGWLVVGSSVIFLTTSLLVYRHTQNFVRTASHTQGTVTELAQGGRDYFPVFTFIDSHGKLHSIKSLSGSYPPAYKIGDKLSVIYQPNNPDNAEIDTFLDVWIWPVVLAGLGVADLLFGFGVLGVLMFLQKSKLQPRFSPMMAQPVVQSAINPQQEATLEISYPKALLVTLISMACFVAGILSMHIPIKDPLLVCTLVVMVTVMTFVFAGGLCFMLRCKIGYDGLRPAIPTFYQRVLRWEDIAVVRGFASPFYSVRCRAFRGNCFCRVVFS